uniref:11.6K protein n=1 Tax=Human adenovirus C serotype 2 TaxID=10515 RepID=Q912J6_ADE02|nr:11.6K protein [Human adenovirus 2]
MTGSTIAPTTDYRNTTATGLTFALNLPQVHAFVNDWASLDMWWFSIALMFVCLIIMWLICCLKRRRARPPIYRPIIVLNPHNEKIHRLDGLKPCSLLLQYD